MYSRETVEQKTLCYFGGDSLATSVWMNKYCMKDRKGNYLELTPDDTHKRLAKEFARIERRYGGEHELNEAVIYEMFQGFNRIVPQGSVMACLGDENYLGSLSNCVSLPQIYDSYDSIAYTDAQLTQLYRRRCGVGIDISTLRPEGSFVRNIAKASTGPVSFMDRFSNTTKEVAMEGRRGALMISMRVNHPDIEKFVNVKRDLRKVTGANISVFLTDEFMEAVESNGEFALQYPTDSSNPQIIKKVRAASLWKSIVESARDCAEPGLLFLDRHEKYNPAYGYESFRGYTVNPCSEIFMSSKDGKPDACRLISSNVFGYVDDPFTDKSEFNFAAFRADMYNAQRLSDDLVDLEIEYCDRILEKIKSDPEPEYVKEVGIKLWNDIKDSARTGRRTGLGFTGLADMFASLGIKYDSEEAIELLQKIMKTKCKAEFDSSIDMARDRGAFDGFSPEKDNTSQFTQMMQEEFPETYHRMMQFGRRNISLSTVSPSGSVSLLTQTSSGLEPVFKLSYIRRTKVNSNSEESRVDFVDDSGDSWQHHEVYHQKAKMWMDITGNKTLDNSPFIEAEDIDWKKRVDLQAMIGKYTTHSISSTINLPKGTTSKTVSDIYFYAWKKGLKGVTIYVDGSRDGVLISSDTKRNGKLVKTDAPKRPKSLECNIHRLMSQYQYWYVIVGMMEGEPYEVFALKDEKLRIPRSVTTGSLTRVSRGCYNLETASGVFKNITELFETDEEEALTRMISTSLRHGSDISFIVSQLMKSKGIIFSFSKAIARTLNKYIKDPKGFQCSDCGSSNVRIEEGCFTCIDCGSSKCS